MMPGGAVMPMSCAHFVSLIVWVKVIGGVSPGKLSQQGGPGLGVPLMIN